MANTKIRLEPLLIEEIASNGGYTHLARITADHLTETTANTAQSFDLPALPKGWILHKGLVVLNETFEDKSDDTFNTTPFILGDVGDDDRYVTTTELNENGTEITYAKQFVASFQFTSQTTPIAKFSAMAAKALNDLDKGELHLLLQIIDTNVLSDLAGDAVISKT